MKITIDCAGDDIHMTVEREPMDWDRFFAICVLVGIYMVGSGVLKFFAMMAR